MLLAVTTSCFLSEQCSLLTAGDFDIEIDQCDLIGLITPGVPLFDNEPIRKCHTAALKAYRFSQL